MPSSAAVLEALPVAAASIRLRQRGDTGRKWKPLPHQIPPDGDWRVWLLLAGRGAGKTDAAAHYLNEHVAGPPCLPGFPGGHRPIIVAPTLGDAVGSCVNGPSGLKAHNPGVRLVQTAGGTHARWPNGVEAKLFGAYTPEDAERLRAGGNNCVCWAEELAAWSKLDEAWAHMQFGLRLGPRPHVVASTTPKPRPLLIKLLGQPSTAVTKARTDDNPHLNAEQRAALYETFGGTRLGRQELDAELLTDVEGALWTRGQIEALRVGAAPPLLRIVIGLDPSGSTSGNEAGIVAGGIDAAGHGYVLEDASLAGSPDAWARAAVGLYDDLAADRLVAEINYGGEMVEKTIRTVDPSVSYRAVHASRGKIIRAEPIAALYEQGRVHHVGCFPLLEDEMCNYTKDAEFSPNRLDALVWMLTEVMLGGGGGLPAVGGQRAGVAAVGRLQTVRGR